MNHLNEEQFVLYYYGEQADGVEDHLGACEQCRDAYHALQRVLNSVDSLPVPERGADYEAQVWQSVSERLPRRRSFAARWFSWRPLAVAAAMAVLVVAAFLAGRTWRKPAGTLASADPQVRERVLMVAVGDHLERSQMVLVELANAGTPNGGALDISYEQRAAEDLVESNRLYRQTAMSAGDDATAGVLEELENVLLDIAHSPSEVSAKQLEDLRKEIEGRGILFKVKVFGTQVEEKAIGAERARFVRENPMKTIVKYLGIVAIAAAPLAAQQDVQDQVDRAMALAKAAVDRLQAPEVQDQVDRAMAQAKAAMDKIQTPELQDQVARAMAQAQKAMENVKLPQLEQVQRELENLKIDMPDVALGDLKFKLDGMLAFGMQDAGDRAREARERSQEARERARELKDRGRESEDRNIEIYRSGTSAIDDHRYERGVENMDRVIATKWARADGAYYWKAYALNKLGKRDEALAALAEIPKQFPQSRWIGDANALRVEIQQASGNPVSPDSQSDEDLRILAINSLMNSDAERAIPLLEKVLNDPKNNLGLKSRALFVLAQSRSDKGRATVLQYAKSGTNPDLQIRAINYLGTFRSQASQQALADVYAANTDVAVRRAVLRSMATSRDSAHLFASAKSESNADLRREAIRSLGQMQAASELSQLYASETSPELKESIIASLMMSRDGDKLMEIARTEKNAELRGDAIRYLGTMHNDKSADGLKSLYAAETDKNVKDQIIRTLGQQGAGKQLVDIARAEKDPELKKEDVQWLGRMHGSKEATDYLMELINK